MEDYEEDEIDEDEINEDEDEIDEDDIDAPELGENTNWFAALVYTVFIIMVALTAWRDFFSR